MVQPFTNDPELEPKIQRRFAEIAGKQNPERAERYLRARALTEKPNTVLRDVSDLRDYSVSQRGRSINLCDLADLQQHISGMTRGGQPNADGTKAQKLITLRTYHRWVHEVDYPGGWKKVKIPEPEIQFLDPSQLISEGDELLMLAAADGLYEKSMIKFQDEAGLRSGELKSLTYECFAKEGSVYRVTLPKKEFDGRRQRGLKTGQRRITIVESVALLDLYFEGRQPEDWHPKFPVWPSRTKGSKFSSPLKRDEPRKLCTKLEKALAEQGIQKHIYPHLFRHTAATRKARKGWSTSQLNKFFGWSPLAKTAARYIHLADSDIEDRVLQDAGLAPKRSPLLSPAVCRHCGFDNLQAGRFCSDCGEKTDATVASKQEQETSGLEEDFLRAVEEAIRFVRLSRGRNGGKAGDGAATGA